MVASTDTVPVIQASYVSHDRNRRCSRTAFFSEGPPCARAALSMFLTFARKQTRDLNSGGVVHHRECRCYSRVRSNQAQIMARSRRASAGWSSSKATDAGLFASADRVVSQVNLPKFSFSLTAFGMAGYKNIGVGGSEIMNTVDAG